MENYDIQVLQSKLNEDLNVGAISGRVILDRLRLIDEDSRKTAPYLDHKYAPFYYYFGKYIKPKTLLEIGFDLGLLSCSFLTSCKTVNNFLGFHEANSEYVSTRIGKSNIKLRFKNESNFYLGQIHDDQFQQYFLNHFWDVVLINEETSYDKHLDYLEFVWEQMSENGILIAEYINRHEPAKEAFEAFSHSKNRKSIIFQTRYGTGIIQK
jgi:hypothetical protein